MTDDRARSRSRRRDSREHGRRPSRSRTPPAVRPAADPPTRTILWTRDNCELLAVTFAEVIKLVEVERLLIAHNRATPAIRRGDLPSLTVLKGLLTSFMFQSHHVGSVARYAVEDGEDHVVVQADFPDKQDELPLPLLSVSSKNPFAEGHWEGWGERELAHLHQDYLRRHKRGLSVDQAAAIAWRRSAALSWYKEYRDDEEGLGKHLHRLIDEMRDRRELQRWARKFDLEPAEAGTAAAAAAAAVQSPRARQAQQQERRREERRSSHDGLPQLEEQRGREEPPHRGERREERREEQREERREERQGGREEHRSQRTRRDDSPPALRQQQQSQRQQHRGQVQPSRSVQEAPQQSRAAAQQGSRLRSASMPAVDSAPGSLPASHAAAAVKAANLPTLALAPSSGTEDAGELPPHLADMQQPAPHYQQQQQQPRPTNVLKAEQAGQPALGLARHFAEDQPLAGDELPLPPHLLAAAGHQAPSWAALAAASATPAPAFIPLGGEARNALAASIPNAQQHHVPVATDMLQQQMQQAASAQQQHSQQQQQQQGGPAAASNEMQAARLAAVAAARQSRDPRKPPSQAGKAAGSQVPAAPTLNAADPGKSQAAADTAAPKRKRAAIQWQPQPQQEGDTPLQPVDAGTGAAPAAAAAAKPAAGKRAAALPEPSPKAKQQKVAAGSSASGLAAAPPKNFTITLRNKVARDCSPAPSEEGELRPSKPSNASRQDARGGTGTSRLASASPAAQLPAATMPGAATWQQQQQQQQQGQHRPSDGGASAAAGVLSFPVLVRDDPPADEAPAFPPGFGDGNSRQQPVGLRAVDSAADAGSTGGSLTVRVVMPAAAYGRTYSGAQQQHQQQQHHHHDQVHQQAAVELPPGYMMNPAASLQQQYGAGLGGVPAYGHQQAAPTYGGGAVLPAGAAAMDDLGNRYASLAAAAAAALAPSPPDAYFLTAAQQLPPQQQLNGQQQQQQQHFVSYAPTAVSELPAGFDGSGGYAAASPRASMQPAAQLQAPAEEERQYGRSQGGGGRRVELEPGSGGSGRSASAGGRQGKSAKAAGSGSSSSMVTGDACWDPVVVFEVQLLEILKARGTAGISVGDLQERLPMPPCMPQSFGAYRSYLVHRKQLCTVHKSQRGSNYDMVQYASGSEGWLAYKRSILQLLADRRPRLEVGVALRQIAAPSRLPDWMRQQAERDFAAFCSKYLRDEVAVVPGGKGRMLLELKPFSADAGGPGFPQLAPPFGRPCPHRQCKWGEQCYFVHAEPRPYHDSNGKT